MTARNRYPRLFQAYEILGIVPTLDVDTVREAFRQLAQLHHPDRFASDADKRTAHERFVEIINAKDFVLETIEEPSVVDAFDAAPLTIGYEQSNGLLQPIFREGTIIPCGSVQDVKIVSNTDRRFVIEVYQGVRPIARDNPVLCAFELESALNDHSEGAILSARMRFEINELGILRVEAYDAKTGAELKIVLLDRQGGLSQNDIDAHKEQAQKNRSSDKTRAREARGKN